MVMALAGDRVAVAMATVLTLDATK
jgi:hypothetical protein